MTKAELIAKVAEETGLTKASATKSVNAVFKALSESLKKKEKTTIPGFGTFKISERKARKGLNPKTKQKISIPAKTVSVWRPAKELKSL